MKRSFYALLASAEAVRELNAALAERGLQAVTRAVSSDDAPVSGIASDSRRASVIGVAVGAATGGAMCAALTVTGVIGLSLVTAVTAGVIAGVIISGITAALVGFGLTRTSVSKLEKLRRAGGVIVIVSAEEADANRARSLARAAGATVTDLMTAHDATSSTRSG